MDRKCPACGSDLPVKSGNCSRCALILNKVTGSCTGVKYPCCYRCRKCYYHLVYAG